MADEIPAFDLYAELEVSERASVETIQAAYRSLQLRNHPDRAGNGSGERAVRLNVARDWLTDPARRAQYDAHLAAERRSAAGRQAGGDQASRAPGDHPDAAAAGAAPPADATPDGDGDRAGDDAPWAARLASLLHAVRHHLRIDVQRLGRIWIVGLAVVGVFALLPGIVDVIWLRTALAGIAVLILVALALGLPGPTGESAMTSLIVRWTSMLLGWVLLAILAAEGVTTLVSLVSGGLVPAGTADLALPVLAATALISVFAIRRRHGPAETSVDEFLEMTPREFEAEVGRILGRHGYRLAVTGGPGDLVADLAGTGPDGRSTVVQCKRYAPGHPVGSRDVQLLIAMGMRHHNAERLVLVTTSDFTDPARDLADEHEVELISGEDLEDLTR